MRVFLLCSFVQLVVWVLCCTIGGAAYAEDERAIEVKMQRIRAAVTSTEKEIEALRTEFAALIKQRKELESSLVALRSDEQRLQKKVTLLAKERDKQQQKVKVSEERLVAERAKIQARLKGLYSGAAPAMSPLMAWRAKGPELERFAVYVRSVRARDEAHFRAVRSVAEELISHRQKLEEAIAEGKRLQEELLLKRTEAESKMATLKGLVEQISSKQKAAQRSLAKLSGESERLEVLLSSITGGGSADTALAGKRAEQQVRDEMQKPERVEGEAAETLKQPNGVGQDGQAVRASVSLAPQGLFSRGISIGSPVSGKVLQHFGKVKVTEFADMIFSKGLEFSSAAGASVHAVLHGKVAYVGSMPAYETVVVLDHGARSYSLYGRLGSSAVQKGQLIEKDTVVGTTSAPDKKGRNFYFEVRKNGSPVDPESVLTKVSR
jgi:septal ring factor EnvC (AmiA/AmiB activator)